MERYPTPVVTKMILTALRWTAFKGTHISKIRSIMITFFSAAFFVRFVFAVTFAVTTKFLTNTFSTAALEIAVRTFYRQTLEHDVSHMTILVTYACSVVHQLILVVN